MNYLALLRAINVGGHTVKMTDLQKMFQTMGFQNVSTYIQSGNVLFDSPETDVAKLTKLIEDHLQSKLGYEVLTCIRTPDQMNHIVTKNPFTMQTGDPEARLYVAFLHSAPPKEFPALLASLETDVDSFAMGEQEIYWLYLAKNGVSAFTRKPLEQQIKLPLTMRNWNVTQKLAELVALRRE